VITKDHIAIRELRLELNMSLKEAGERVGLSSKSIGAIENGRVLLSKERIEGIVKSYGLSYLDFVRVRIIIDKNFKKTKKRITVKTVLKNSDRRSYQKILTKESKTLRSMRRIKKLTQYQAAELCGYSRTAIGHIENGRIEITDYRAKHIVESYGYKYSDYKDFLKKEELRDNVVDTCLSQIELLSDEKLDIVKKLLGSL
jgi:transcriptional regulator with XRE-family HTH domain